MSYHHEDQIIYIAITEISVNPYQPRRVMDEELLESLADSIRQYGLLQPIIVRPAIQGFQLVSGERRLRAAIMIGLLEIPAIVRNIEPEQSALMALVENLQRTDLSFWDEAEGFFRLQQEFSMTQAEIARYVGKSQSAVANKMRILNLETDIREKIENAGLSERHARVLLSLPHNRDRAKLCDLMIQNHWTVREAESWVAKFLNGAPAEDKPIVTRRTIVKDFRIIYNTFKKTLSSIERSGMAAEMSHSESDGFWEIRVKIPKNQEG